MPLRTCSTFRPGSSNIAYATASCGISRDYLNPISGTIATPLILCCKNNDLNFVICSVMPQNGCKQLYKIFGYRHIDLYNTQNCGSCILPCVMFFERWRTLLADGRTTTILIISLRFVVSLSDVYHGFYSIRSGNSATVDFSYK